MKKILIISSRFGGGHRSSAEAILEGLSLWYPDIQTHHLDFGDIIGKRLNRFLTKSYTFYLKHLPSIHQLLASGTSSTTALKILSIGSSPITRHRLELHLKEIQPDLVVATFPAANRLLDDLKPKYNFQLVTIVTDLLSIHPYWVSPGTDHYITALPEMDSPLTKLGVDKKKIHSLGFVVRPSFLTPQTQQTARQKLNLDPKKFTPLYLLGSMTDRFTLHLAKTLDTNPDFQPIIICGNNQDYYDKLKPILKNTHLVGFTRNFSDYLTAADLAIGKAGPGFIMECALLGRPVLLTSYIAPQEKGNVQLVLDRKFGFYTPKAKLVLDRLRILHTHPKKLPLLQANARATAQPNSTRQIVDFLANL